MNNSNEAAEVCLVDDDPSVLRSMQYLLASDGLAVHAFNNAEDFLAHVSKHRVPVVVLDIWMERVTGLEVLARLCALSPKTRVIVITARDDLAARESIDTARRPAHLCAASDGPGRQRAGSALVERSS